jgi:serine protease Do
VPINMARYALERLISDGKVARGYLGLQLQPELTPELAKQLDLPNLNGALVTMVTPGSPAAKAGFEKGDLITEFNGRQVKDMRQFRLLVSQTAPGRKVTLRVVRDGKEKSLTATLGEMPNELVAGEGQAQPSERRQSKTDALDGVEVSDLDAQARREADVPEKVHGVLVSKVDEESNASEAGLRAGDVIIEIDRQPVHSADEAVTLSEKVKGDRILLRVWRGGEGGGGMLFLSVDNTKRK